MAAASRKPLEVADYETLAQFRYLLARFLAFSEDAAVEAGLSPRQHQALLAIKGFPGAIAIGDLAERLVIRHHSAVGLVNRLEAAGYLRRAADAKDKRRIILTLTKKGESALAALTAAHRDELRRLTPSLKPLLARLED